MDPTMKAALAEYLIAMADDELILAHRDSEWTGHAPILEEDIAFTNISLDEIGHATLWYQLAAELLGEDPKTYPDQLAFLREAEAYRCAQIVELPKGDWGFSILRQYLFDTFEGLHLTELAQSRHAALAQAAAKVQKEEQYHLRHTEAWVRRLGSGTAESQNRMQEALDTLWPHALQVVEARPGEAELDGVAPGWEALREAWLAQVVAFLTEAGLAVPEGREAANREREKHSEHLPKVLVEMQKVARMGRGARW